MKPVECEFEPEVLAAVLQSRWPGRVDAALCEHVAECAICSDVAVVAGVLEGQGRLDDRLRSASTIQRRVVRATGLTHGAVRQIERASTIVAAVRSCPSPSWCSRAIRRRSSSWAVIWLYDSRRSSWFSDSSCRVLRCNSDNTLTRARSRSGTTGTEI